MSIVMTPFKSRALTLTALVVLPICFLAGCMSLNPRSLRTMETALMESNTHLDIESSMTFGIGALTMNFVDFAFVHDRSIDLSKISRAEVGVYELRSRMALNNFTMPKEVTADRACPRREIIVQVREEDEYTQIVVCIRKEKVTGLAVFVLEPDELVVINARGDFEAIVSSLVKESVKRKAPERETRVSADNTLPPTAANESAHAIPPSS